MTNGPGFGFMRPKNIRIRQIRIRFRNTGFDIFSPVLRYGREADVQPAHAVPRPESGEQESMRHCAPFPLRGFLTQVSISETRCPFPFLYAVLCTEN